MMKSTPGKWIQEDEWWLRQPLAALAADVIEQWANDPNQDKNINPVHIVTDNIEVMIEWPDKAILDVILGVAGVG